MNIIKHKYGKRTVSRTNDNFDAMPFAGAADNSTIEIGTGIQMVLTWRANCVALCSEG